MSRLKFLAMIKGTTFLGFGCKFNSNQNFTFQQHLHAGLIQTGSFIFEENGSRSGSRFR